ncbi:putative disease resistance protein RGA1 [Vigna angularis]|uniref:putative disease resistance protein RGA1 n=1 Tax=Phaseolus angularis TaxID=3914 RepID=UPI0022B3CEB1|nr:putative disease resistance protein RGA1 [Vigna angularis]
MAESFLFSIAESLIAKLASRTFQEAYRLVGLYDDLQDLTNTLSLVKDVLLDAEQKQEHNHELRRWLSQLKTVFSDAEDVLDEFECQTLRKKVVKAHGSTKDKVSHFFSSSNPLVFRYKMAQQIKDINNRLDKVEDNKRKFSLQTSDVDTRVVHRRDMTHSRVSDSDVIGRKHDKEKIIELLMQQNPDDDDTSLSVIPIVGIGGLGKTTLAKFVFNDKKIQECFPLKMWVCVSDDFDIKQLIIKIINSVNDSESDHAPIHQMNLNMLDLEQLQNQLKNKLSGQKFLLVLDDVWNEDRVKWYELRNLIQVSAAGSKILVTTRSSKVSSMMETTSSHTLEGLSEEDSLSVLVKWAFKEGEEEKYPHLENIGREIVKKCGGVPLAVRTLGSLLFSKFEANEWEYVSQNEIWNLPQKKDDILPALKLSYDLMPSYLRQCFALFSLYPKDYQYNSYEIIWLWGALGLIALPKTDRTREDVANQYLHELLSRSFLQDFQNFGTVYNFRIHDLVHDLALFVAMDECLHINSNIQNIPDNIRHLSFAESGLFSNLITKKSAAVRTVMFPNGVAAANCRAILKTCLEKFKCLRVLDLSHATFETLPRKIGKLKHLRYLDIRGNPNIKRLPDSICKLQSLQVLSLAGCVELEALPKRLKKLMSLYCFEFSTKQTVLPMNEIANLVSLEFLTVVSCHNVESIFGGMKFPTLKTLSVFDCQSLKSLLLEGKNFPQLETLYVKGCSNLDLELWKGDHEEQSPKLKLKFVLFSTLSQLVTLPKWFEEVANSLQCLIVVHCHNFESFPDWLPVLTDMKTLAIKNCPKLVALPDNIHLFTTLEYLAIVDCAADLHKKYEPHIGEFWPKISHINNIFIDEPEDLDEEFWSKISHINNIFMDEPEDLDEEFWSKISHINNIFMDELEDIVEE